MIARTTIHFAITYAGSWTVWLAAAELQRSSATSSALRGVASVLVYVGIFAPAIVALAMTLREAGRQGVRALVASLFRWRVGVRWYVFALGFMAAVKLTAAAVQRAALGEWPVFGTTSPVLMLAATLVSVVILGQAGEELGWRGYALPRLASRLGLGWASVLLGVVWAVWHLPIFYLFTSADKYGQSFPLYLAQVVPLSVAIAWLWWRTDGSLLLTMLLHAAINNTKDIVPSVSSAATSVWAVSTSRPVWIAVSVLWLCAAVFLFDMRRAPSTSRPS